MPEQIPSTGAPQNSSSGPKVEYAKNILSPKNIIIYLVAAVIIYAGVYYYFFAKNKKSENLSVASPQLQEEGVNDQTLIGNEMIVEVKALNGSGVEGLAFLTEENGKIKVDLNTTEEAGSQPAHIHEGSCPSPGQVKWQLTSVAKGSSSTDIPVTLAELKEALPLAINIHKSASDLTNYVACGDVK